MADANSLLDALMALKPNEPGPEWQTLQELVDAASQKGTKIAKHSMQTRLSILLKAGKLEQIRAPRRGVGNGWQFYYREKR